MVEESTALANFIWTVKRTTADTASNGVNNRIHIPQEVDNGREIYVDVHRNPTQSNDLLTSYSTSVYETREAFTLPSKIIEQEDIKPGETLRFVVHGSNPTAEQKELDDANDTPDQKELIEDMHEKVTELYEAYHDDL